MKIYIANTDECLYKPNPFGISIKILCADILLKEFVLLKTVDISVLLRIILVAVIFPSLSIFWLLYNLKVSINTPKHLFIVSCVAKLYFIQTSSYKFCIVFVSKKISGSWYR